MELLIIEKLALDELYYRLDLLQSKLNMLYSNSGVAPQDRMDNQQACIYLSASKRTMQNLRDSGILPYTKIGAKVFYKPEDIEKMLLIGYRKD
jgi:hypothetical protein